MRESADKVVYVVCSLQEMLVINALVWVWDADSVTSVRGGAKKGWLSIDKNGYISDVNTSGDAPPTTGTSGEEVQSSPSQ